MKITQALLDDLTAQAKVSPRLRVCYGLLNSLTDHSQRVLNSIDPGSPILIHRHQKRSEPVIISRGYAQELFFLGGG